MMSQLPRLRQVVLITADLEASLARARAAFSLPEGVRDTDGMAAIGFEHEVLGFDQTFLEIVAPLSADSPQAQLVNKQGDSGFMAVLQVGDLAAVIERADGLGFAPVLQEDYEGHPITQWHPKDLGTIAELDQMEPVDTWHFAPRCFEIGSTEVAQDIAAAEIAVDDPEAMASRWATVLGIEAEGSDVRLGAEAIRFVPIAGGPRGLRAVDLVASDPARVGETTELCGVVFRLVAASSAEAS